MVRSKFNFYLTHKLTLSIKKTNDKAILMINLTINTTDALETMWCVRNLIVCDTLMIQVVEEKLSPSKFLQDLQKFMIS